MAKLFELSRKRLQSLFNDKSLKRNAIETIIASFNSWTSLNEQNGLAGRLSPALRDVLLQEVLRRIKCPEKFKKLARVIPFLLSSVTMTLDLKVLYLQMSYDYVGLYYIDEVLYMAAQLAPNIQRLVFKNRGIVQDQYNAANYALFSLLANNYRCLQILEVQDFSADLHDLLFLCGHSPSLRVLKLNSVLYVFTPTGEEISMQLCNLRLLVVENVSSQSIQIIRQHVPNIDIVFDLKHTGLSYDDFLYPIGNPNLSQRKIFTFDQSWFDHPDTEIHERHPNIIHLQVVGEDAFDVGEANLFLPNFTKISSLSIETANQEIKIFLMQLAKIFLHQYGQNLRSFSLQLGDPEDPNDDVAFNIEHLFNSCPNIESLSLEESNGFVGPHFEVFAPLKKISWIGYYEFEPNFFMMPQLQKLELTKIISLTLGDSARRIATLIAEKEILHELEILRIDFGNGFTANDFLGVALMMKSASGFLPKLTDLKLSCDGSEYVALARNMKTNQNFKTEFISEKTFDEGVKDVFVDDELINTLALYQNYNWRIQ